MKRLSVKHFNILFHTHTVSGIAISAVLFIMFFAGAIALYKQEVYQWEDPEARIKKSTQLDYERMMHRLASVSNGGMEIHELRVILPTDAKPIYTFYLTGESEAYETYTYNPLTDSLLDLKDGEGATVGETLYRLHFLDQLPWYIGRYIAGFVALFFSFAVVTGLLIHWQNIRSKFFAFSFRDLRKQFWTNAHTVFGILGLPFQLMYAITGAFYMLSLFILAPAVFVLFGGDQGKLVTMIYPPEAFHAHGEDARPATNIPVQQLLDAVRADYPDATVSYLEIVNPGHDNAVMSMDLIDPQRFNSDGLIIADLNTGNYKLTLSPGEKNYQQSLLQGISKLHFATFGGWPLKLFYFLLSMISCFVIISGVMMWKQARNKPSYTEGQRRFHHRITMAYLAVCFSLLPATALLFNAEHWVPKGADHVDRVNAIFFGSWFMLSVVCYFMKNERDIFIRCLVLMGIFALLVPISNGWRTGDWGWEIGDAYPYVSIVDGCWLLVGIIAVFCAGYSQKQRATNLS
ncbi:PepSY-associated TM helix domain-containing protein [Sphingobacterium bambusae]|uniref:PepSY-associated TM helix domain-containing protein n=1 Tax=Sphingobacterium bambusae TaxID=662858 RepID=A0ABW6BFQ5_9SPHI|nr:PepSY-associated TM helix domain-containing protein [Sphingobacterium bambusae]WPL49514.1 PepSY-associated TM helix domain-containing protein [Sphingobacterium bambusae]